MVSNTPLLLSDTLSGKNCCNHLIVQYVFQRESWNEKEMICEEINVEKVAAEALLPLLFSQYDASVD